MKTANWNSVIYLRDFEQDLREMYPKLLLKPIFSLSTHFMLDWILNDIWINNIAFVYYSKWRQTTWTLLFKGIFNHVELV